jgi:signal transduction histidine kinase
MAEMDGNVREKGEERRRKSVGGWLPRLFARVPATVHTKLIGAFLAIVALLVTFGAVGLRVLSDVNRRAENFIKVQRKTAAYRQLQNDTTGQLYSVTSALLAPNERMLESSLRQLHQFRYDLERGEFVSKDEIELFERIRDEHERLVQVVTRVVELTRAGDVAEALELRLTEAQPIADRLERLTNEMVNRAEADMVATIDENHEAYAVSRWVVIGFAVGSTGLALLLGFGISRSLVEPVKRMDERLRQIASGDFTRRVEVPNRDELGGLAENVNRMNEELRGLYRQIEVASRHKSEFLANVSHELRTPLNAIIGYSEMLMEDAEEGGREAAVADLLKIRASGKHLLALIKDILDLSKIEAGKINLYTENFDVVAMINDVASTVRPLAEENGNTLEIRCHRDTGTMHADPTRVRQMLFNLLSNACKFTERGVVSLDVARHAQEDGEWLGMEVSDTGIGMTPKQVEKLFVPFSQAEGGTTRKYGGTGLGLAITRQFCDIMGGSITVRSSYGVGTTFSVRLPMRAGQDPARRARSPVFGENPSAEESTDA